MNQSDKKIPAENNNTQNDTEEVEKKIKSFIDFGERSHKR